MWERGVGFYEGVCESTCVGVGVGVGVRAGLCASVEGRGGGTVVAFRGNLHRSLRHRLYTPAGTDVSFYQDGEYELIGALRECGVCACVIDGFCCL